VRGLAEHPAEEQHIIDHHEVPWDCSSTTRSSPMFSKAAKPAPEAMPIIESIGQVPLPGVEHDRHRRDELGGFLDQPDGQHRYRTQPAQAEYTRALLRAWSGDASLDAPR
jgi:hypothetical protein